MSYTREQIEDQIKLLMHIADSMAHHERMQSACDSDQCRVHLEDSLRCLISSLLAENDALREDAERLNWMESKGRVSIERVREGRIDGPLRWDVEFGHDGREAKSKKGFRQAIDAARKKG